MKAIETLDAHPEVHVSLRQLAIYWNVNRRTIRKWVDSNSLPHLLLGGNVVRVRTVDALEFERKAFRNAA